MKRIVYALALVMGFVSLAGAAIYPNPFTTNNAYWNINQFQFPNGTLQIKSGAKLTNATVSGTFTGNAGSLTGYTATVISALGIKPPILYVSATNGNNANAGWNPMAPVLTLSNAVWRATNGVTILVDAGTYDLGTNQLILGDNINLFGVGRDLVDIIGSADCSGHEIMDPVPTGGPQIRPGNNSQLKHFTVTCDTNALATISGHSKTWSGIGVSAGNPPANVGFTNVLLEDIYIRRGYFDAFHFNSTNRCEVTIKDCLVDNDGVGFSSVSGQLPPGTNSVYKLINCTFNSKGNVPAWAASAQIPKPGFAQCDGTIYLENCKGSISGTGAAIFGLGTALYGGNPWVFTTDCAFDGTAILSGGTPLGEPSGNDTRIIGHYSVNQTNHHAVYPTNDTVMHFSQSIWTPKAAGLKAEGYGYLISPFNSTNILGPTLATYSGLISIGEGSYYDAVLLNAGLSAPEAIFYASDYNTNWIANNTHFGGTLTANGRYYGDGFGLTNLNLTGLSGTATNVINLAPGTGIFVDTNSATLNTIAISNIVLADISGRIKTNDTRAITITGALTVSNALNIPLGQTLNANTIGAIIGAANSTNSLAPTLSTYAQDVEIGSQLLYDATLFSMGATTPEVIFYASDYNTNWIANNTHFGGNVVAGGVFTGNGSGLTNLQGASATYDNVTNALGGVNGGLTNNVSVARAYDLVSSNLSGGNVQGLIGTALDGTTVEAFSTNSIYSSLNVTGFVRAGYGMYPAGLTNKTILGVDSTGKIVEGTHVDQTVGSDGWYLASSNGVRVWSRDAWAITNLNPAYLISGTVTGALYSSASSASNAPAANEFPTAHWVRNLFNNGLLEYATTNVDIGATNEAAAGQLVYKYWLGAIPVHDMRTYTAPGAGTYIGNVVTTNTFVFLQGPITVNSYMELAGGTGGRFATVHAELYYSYDKTNWFGDWESPSQSIAFGVTNLYQWVVSFPSVTATNSTGFYVQRRLKVDTIGSSPNIIVHLGTNTPSHIALSGPNSAAGNAYLPNDQVFTGSNYFSKLASANSSYSTNTITTGNGTATMDMLKSKSYLATNANITISLLNVPTTTDRAATLWLSNSAASGSITVTLSGFSCLTNGVPTQTFFVTNNDAKQQFGVLSVNCYGNIITNAVYAHFYNP